MIRLPVSYRPAASDDLADIFRYIFHASGNAVIAEGFVRRLKRR